MIRPEYSIYLSAKARCERPSCTGFKNYGGRGIEFHFKNFSEFIEAVGLRPDKRLSLDRINNDGHYEPGNVRWTTRSIQVINSRKRSTWKNTSRFKGVDYFPYYAPHPKWRARITQNGRVKSIGYYKTEEAAAQAYDSAARALFGEDASCNFPQTRV